MMSTCYEPHPIQGNFDVQSLNSRSYPRVYGSHPRATRKPRLSVSWRNSGIIVSVVHLLTGAQIRGVRRSM